MRMCVAAKPLLAKSKNGAIVNTASMLSFFGGALVPAYTASKGGIAQLTKSLAMAWARGRHSRQRHCAGLDQHRTHPRPHSDEARSEAILARTPMKRWGEPADIGGASFISVPTPPVLSPEWCCRSMAATPQCNGE